MMKPRFTGLTKLLLLFGLLACVAIQARAQTLDTIEKRGTLLVGVNLSTPPFGTTDSEMQPAGYDVEVAKLLAQDLGVKLQFVPVTNDSRIPTLLTGKADVIIASLQITSERVKSIIFSTP